MTSQARAQVLSLPVLLALCAASGGAAERVTARDLGAPRVAVRRAVRSSAVVVEGTPRKFRGGSSTALFYVASSLKGEIDPRSPIVVDFQKAPYGTWPKRGQKTLLCLAKGEGKHSYQLVSYYASVLPATARVKSAVRRMLGGTDVRGVGRDSAGAGAAMEGASKETLRGARPLPRVELADEYAERVFDSETVLLGTLTDVRPSREGLVGALKIEDALVGYGKFKAPVRVEFASRGGRRGARVQEPPSAGRYVLFLRGSERGRGFRIIPGGAGVVRLDEKADEPKIKKAVAALGDYAGPNRLGLTTVQATLAEWQDAWNTRSLERCMSCYSRRNPLRRQYGSGGRGRRRLAEQIRTYPGEVRIVIQRVERSGVYAAAGHQTATVTVALTLSAGGARERRTAKMKFVREGREWLILEEGF